MTDYDLLGDPEEELSATELRKRADRIVFRNEFAVAYEEPIGRDARRSFLTAWVTLDHTQADDPVYERKQGRSGYDRVVRGHLAEMVENDDVAAIERFIEEGL